MKPVGTKEVQRAHMPTFNKLFGSESERAKLVRPLGENPLAKGPNTLKPLFSEVGHIQKTSDKLMFALVACKFPSSYDEDQALDGHPSMFMKILHYAIFFSSTFVKNYLYSHEVDPKTIHLNDFKFMERVYFIMSNFLGLKARVQLHQFFKYGFAEQKMMMCVDVIKRVKELSKEIRIKQQLKSTRKMVTRSQSLSGTRFQMPNGPMAQKELAESRKNFVNETGLKIKHSSLAEIQEDMKNDFMTAQQKQANRVLEKKKKRSKKEKLECSMRLIGHQSFQTRNRHRVS
mmetsp:Transcript_7024/g.11803  ORF Transcript_7024/g.11803 Transcript_7024/m.11803 type:complete len:288 (+) Transcript_7024:3-866(+)